MMTSSYVQHQATLMPDPAGSGGHGACDPSPQFSRYAEGPMDTRRSLLEDERRHVMGKLHRLRGTSEITGAETVGGDDIADEGERAQASLRQHLEVATCERLVDRIARLNDALQ